MDVREINLKPNPAIKANPISKLFLFWVIPFLRRGAKKDLNLEDVYHSLPEDASDKLGEQMEQKWKEELTHATMNHRRPRLWKVIARLSWWKLGFIGLGYDFDELVLRIVQPLVLRCFIKSFLVENPEDDPNHQRDQFLYAGALVLAVFTYALFQQNMIGICLHQAIKTRLGFSSLIYRKILRLRKSDSEHLNVGKLCNLLSSDVGRLEQTFHMVQFLYVAPLQLILCTYLLWNIVGVACVGGVGCLVLFLPLQTLVGRFFMYFRVRIAKRTDERGTFLHEILSGVRLLKMYAWEKPFAALISERRRAEIKFVRRILYLRGMYLTVFSVAAKILPFAALILYVVLGNQLTADAAFFTVTIFGIILQAVMHRFPTATSMLGELMASLNRIEEFLLSEDNVRPPQLMMASSTSTISTSGSSMGTTGADDEPSIVMLNYSASWQEEHETLKNLTVDLRGNQLVMIVGHVGSGKSSFLNAILSELPITANDKDNISSCYVQGRMSYASQEAWIFPATIRQNILFGLEMEEERYWKVVKLCCLEEDMNQFPEGDMTLVGERGVALSGGQKARVNLARAIYQQADIYLLDDPLSAVDTKVSNALFHDCIRGELEGTLRILVTHQLQYLPLANHIIVLNRDGDIWGQGTYDKLKNGDMDFTTLISDEYMKNDIPAVVDELQGEEASSSKMMQRWSKNGEASPPTRDKNVPKNVTSSRKEEKKQVGSVGLPLYYRYFRSGGSYFVIVILLLSFIISQVLNKGVDYWLSLWTNEMTVQSNDIFSAGMEQDKDQSFYVYVYCAIVTAFIILFIFHSTLFFWYCMRISINLHDSMFQSLIRAPVKFFDDNPSGRVMNRFTKDLNQIDEQLPVTFYDFMTTLLNLLGTLGLSILSNYYLAIPAVVLLAGLWKLRLFFLTTATDLKRLEAVAKSPMFTHVTTTVQGITTIRALQAEKRVVAQFDKIQDTHTAVFYMSFVSNRWFSIWLEIMVAVFLAVVSFGFLLITTSSQGGNVGMAISSILGMAGTLQWGIRQSAETENFMTSVERVIEYTHLKPEAPLKSSDDEHLPEDWPKQGRLHFEDLSLAYDASGENKVLNKVTFTVNSREKVGIVGRTGAGKSSLITALFRLTEPCHGRITLDDVPIGNLGLHKLRSRISIIPQDPVLFSGTLRYNLDPFKEFSDNQLWRVVEEVDLQHTVQNLDYPVADGGNNFSVGQRQLVCLARAVLRSNRVIVLDEATANCDPATDNLVQRTIRSKFADCTIITIAHRLQTVLDNDRIMVLDEGKIVEYDKPEILLKDEHSYFYDMVQTQQQRQHPNLDATSSS